MSRGGTLVGRKAAHLVREALADTRVVAVNGARQVGKSTLITKIAREYPRAAIRTLDDPALLLAAHEDPVAFVTHDELLAIDEVQRAPELFLPIKMVVDADPTPGRYLLAGSAQILALRDLPDALPGRMETIELWPFSQGELDGTPDRFVDAAFAAGPDLEHESTLTKRDYFERVVRGGFPEAVARTGRRRGAFFESYLRTLLDRDVRELAAIERHGELRRLLALLAGRAASLLVVDSLSAAASIPRTTLNRYLGLLSATFFVKQIPAWSAGQTLRTTATPKIALTDTGLAAHLVNQDAQRLAGPGTSGGPLLENFVLMELARQLTWSETFAQLFHFRTRDGVEVDAVLETGDGRLVAIEVKAAATIRAEDLRGLRYLARRLGDRFAAGFVFYTGPHTIALGDRIRALPLEALWRLAP